MTLKTLFNTADKNDMLARIRRLRPDSKAQWGKMNAAQMLAHCQVGLNVAAGDMKIKRVLIGLLFGRFAKKVLAGPEPFKHGLPTGREFIFSDTRDFARERDQLIAVIERFSAAGPKGLTQEAHPFFGKLSVAEWENLMWKHLDHHVRQFESA